MSIPSTQPVAQIASLIPARFLNATFEVGVKFTDSTAKSYINLGCRAKPAYSIYYSIFADNSYAAYTEPPNYFKDHDPSIDLRPYRAVTTGGRSTPSSCPVGRAP